MSNDRSVSFLKRLALAAALFATAVAALALVLFLAVRWYYEPQLPSVTSLRDLQLQVPLRVYTRDGLLIGEFGAERRAPLAYAQIPDRVIQAFLAAEDDRFFEHPGVDWQGLVRATLKLAATGQKSQGGSTITMQLARAVFLTPERSYVRKIKEILLALRIEHELTKQQILETYLNKIFLGQRAYGVGAAAQAYFGRNVSDISWSEAAVLAGLPKAPSRDNPVANPERAKDRRDYVLRRLRSLNKISQLDYEAALAEPITLRFSLPEVEVDALYGAEMARAELVARYGESAYTGGLKVYTTLESQGQDAANRALRGALTGYDERHGWRGPEARLPAGLLVRSGDSEAGIAGVLDALPRLSGLLPAAVVDFSPERLRLLARGVGLVELTADDFKWTGLSAKKTLQPGDIVRVRRVGERWTLAQIPEAQGALVAVSPMDGAILALAGGYDFLQNKYNRVTQARRQAGSGFKPFLYTAAFDFGFTPASVMIDAPLVFEDAAMESSWRPENYGGDFKGPMRLREALVQSRNLVSIRVLQAIGLDFARNFISRFGLPLERMPQDLSMALGSASFTPLEMARAYSVLANGGFRVEPYLIAEIRDAQDNLLFKAQPARACPDCAAEIVQQSEVLAEAPLPQASAPSGQGLAPRVVDSREVWLVTDILRDVTIRGTAAKARELGRNDIAGKTGTSNDETDAWFYGFTRDRVAVCWVGYDQPTPLGRGEVGGRAALPMWLDYMKVALKGQPESVLPKPPGLISVRIDPATGRLAGAGEAAIFETVQADHVPTARTAEAEPRSSAVEDLY